MMRFHMKKLLLITGDLAAGKSTFANILSDRYHTNVFIKDTIKEVLGNTIGFSNREENKRLSVATMELMMFLFSEFMKLDKDLILEANFHTAELQRLHQMASAYHYQVLTLVLQGDVEILHKRYINRIRNENRHPVHLSTTLDIFDDFQKCTNYLRSAEILGRALHICTNDFSYQTDPAVFAKIDRFMIDS